MTKMSQIILDRQNARHILGSHEGNGADRLESTEYPVPMRLADRLRYSKAAPIPSCRPSLACILPVKDGAALR